MDEHYFNKNVMASCAISESLSLGVANKISVNKMMGGNGAAMRTSPIGLFYYNDIEKVISL